MHGAGIGLPAVGHHTTALFLFAGETATAEHIFLVPDDAIVDGEAGSHPRRRLQQGGVSQTDAPLLTGAGQSASFRNAGCGIGACASQPIRLAPVMPGHDGSGEAMPKRQEQLPEASSVPPGEDPAMPSAHLERIIAQLAACEAMNHVELAQHTGRTLLATLACAADMLLRDGAKGLHAAPDKVAAFFDKAAAGFVQTLEGLHQCAGLMDAAALDATETSPARPRAADPLADAIAAWSSPVIAPPRSDRRAD
jgi:hypothetical protein